MFSCLTETVFAWYFPFLTENAAGYGVRLIEIQKYRAPPQYVYLQDP